MKTNSNAQKVQNVIPKMTIVETVAKEKSAKVINFKASAEEVPSEEVKAEVLPVEQVQETTPIIEEKAVQETAPITEVKAAQEPAPIIILEKPVQSIEEIKRKSEVLSRLTAKWDRLVEKRRRIENFSISHDGDTASAIIRDAQGEVFESNSPKTIGKLIEFWNVEFSEAIAAVEKDMREIA